MKLNVSRGEGLKSPCYHSYCPYIRAALYISVNMLLYNGSARTGLLLFLPVCSEVIILCGIACRFAPTTALCEVFPPTSSSTHFLYRFRV